ncbi:unnamed protein product, partial [Prorocentrum cordatum]
WEDPMSMPVCSEIPWQQVTPLMNKMLHEEYAAEDAALGPAPTRRARTDPMAQPPRLVSPPPSTPAPPDIFRCGFSICGSDPLPWG